MVFFRRFDRIDGGGVEFSKDVAGDHAGVAAAVEVIGLFALDHDGKGVTWILNGKESYEPSDLARLGFGADLGGA